MTTGSNALAEELVKDAFADLYGRFEAVHDPDAYLHRAVINRCTSWVRRRVVERRHQDGRRVEPATWTDPDTVPAMDAIGRLPTHQRAAGVMRYLADWPEADRARALDCRPGTVQSLLSDQSPAAMVQQRAASSVDCWSADTTYVDNKTGRLLTATVGRQGNEPQAECQLPAGYLPADCIAIGGRPAAISHQGTVATISWVTVDKNFASLSGYGFTIEELVTTATSVTFDGTNVSLTPPMAMTLIQNQPKSRDDNRDVTYYNATFSSADDATSPIQLSVTTWDNTSINQVGPATTIDIDGTTAVVVTTGGPGTGITGWTSDPSGASSVNNVVPFDEPAHSYVTWTSNGVTFRIEGPDSGTIIEIARHLRPAEPAA